MSSIDELARTLDLSIRDALCEKYGRVPVGVEIEVLSWWSLGRIRVVISLEGKQPQCFDIRLNDQLYTSIVPKLEQAKDEVLFTLFQHFGEDLEEEEEE